MSILYLWYSNKEMNLFKMDRSACEQDDDRQFLTGLCSNSEISIVLQSYCILLLLLLLYIVVICIFLCFFVFFILVILEISTVHLSERNFPVTSQWLPFGQPTEVSGRRHGIGVYTNAKVSDCSLLHFAMLKKHLKVQQMTSRWPFQMVIFCPLFFGVQLIARDLPAAAPGNKIGQFGGKCPGRSYCWVAAVSTAGGLGRHNQLILHPITGMM